MNERIQKFAEQATKYFPKTETSGEYWTFDKEKFAELIVQECANVLRDSKYKGTNSAYYELFNEALIYGAIKVKKHFGVE